MISIVIPLYNKEKTVSATLQSVLNQDFQDFEVILVDDGSTDRSADIVRQFSDPRLRLIQQSNQGPSVARNRGVREARFSWIAFLDADDRFEPGAFAHFASLIQQHPSVACFVCNYYILKRDKRTLYSRHYSNGIVRDNFKEWFFERLMPCQGTTVYRRDLLLKYPYEASIRRYEDAQMLFAILREHPVYRSDFPTFTYVLSENEASRPRQDIREDYLGHLEWNSNRSFWEQLVDYQFYREAKRLYPQDYKRLYGRVSFPLQVVFSYFLFKGHQEVEKYLKHWIKKYILFR